MACFIVPLTQAIATTVYRKTTTQKDTFLGRNLATLEKMLWGGSVMLIVDHILAGELTWRFPFFTALETDGGGGVMLDEILTVGLPISLAVTAVWAAWCFVKERRAVAKA
ncbi:MAG: hypothetical protein IJS05_03310 [Paludibacteraceae bacterium]|nr:hypothetical protein [Paludibacteraceae bacterium]